MKGVNANLPSLQITPADLPPKQQSGLGGLKAHSLREYSVPLHITSWAAQFSPVKSGKLGLSTSPTAGNTYFHAVLLDNRLWLLTVVAAQSKATNDLSIAVVPALIADWLVRAIYTNQKPSLNGGQYAATIGFVFNPQISIPAAYRCKMRQGFVISILSKIVNPVDIYSSGTYSLYISLRLHAAHRSNPGLRNCYSCNASIHKQNLDSCNSVQRISFEGSQRHRGVWQLYM